MFAGISVATLTPAAAQIAAALTQLDTFTE